MFPNQKQKLKDEVAEEGKKKKITSRKINQDLKKTESDDTM